VRVRGSARGGGAGHAVVGRHVAVVFAVGGQVVCVKAVTALAIAAHVTALGVAVEPAPSGEGASSTSPANACKKSEVEGFRRTALSRQFDRESSAGDACATTSALFHDRPKCCEQLTVYDLPSRSKKRTSGSNLHERQETYADPQTVVVRTSNSGPEARKAEGPLDCFEIKAWNAKATARRACITIATRTSCLCSASMAMFSKFRQSFRTESGTAAIQLWTNSVTRCPTTRSKRFVLRFPLHDEKAQIIR
jgi:hypothetical protein